MQSELRMAEIVILLRIRFIHTHGNGVDHAFQIRRCRAAPDQIRKSVRIDPDLPAVFGFDVTGKFQNFRQPLRRFTVSTENHFVIGSDIPALQLFFHFIDSRIFLQNKAIRIAERVREIPDAELTGVGASVRDVYIQTAEIIINY